MNNIKAEVSEFTCLKDLKPILSSPPPCLSVYMPLELGSPNQTAKANALRWKECLRTLEEKIEQNGSEARELLQSISDWDAITAEEKAGAKSVVVFRSTDVFCVSALAEPVKEKAVVGPHFNVRPLLPELTRDTNFYILALSQKDVRLLRCTPSSSEEVPLPPAVATSFDGFMNSAKPDHVSDNRGTPGPGAGSSKGVMFTTSTDKEDKDEYLAHFFKQIDHGLNEILRGKTEPVVPVGVEYELALYSSVSTYPHLAEEGVHGAPNSLKSGEMHARALEAMGKQYEKKVDDALTEYNHKAGGGASNRLKDIIPAAHEGRVLTLLVSDSLEATGSFDENTYTVKGRETGTSEDEDLVNDAVVQTILHAGQVFVAPNGKMPNGAPLSAIFRF